MNVNAQFGRRDYAGSVHRRDIWLTDHPPGIEAHQQVGHGRVAGNCRQVDICAGYAASVAQGPQCIVDAVDDEAVELIQAVGFFHVVDSGQHIGTDGDLGVVEHRFAHVRACGKIDDAQHHAGGAQING